MNAETSRPVLVCYSMGIPFVYDALKLQRKFLSDVADVLLQSKCGSFKLLKSYAVALIPAILSTTVHVFVTGRIDDRGKYKLRGLIYG
jgi:hypothetical protein